MTDAKERDARERVRRELSAQGGCVGQSECLHCRQALDAYRTAVRAALVEEIVKRVEGRRKLLPMAEPRGFTYNAAIDAALDTIRGVAAGEEG